MRRCSWSASSSTAPNRSARPCRLRAAPKPRCGGGDAYPPAPGLRNSVMTDAAAPDSTGACSTPAISPSWDDPADPPEAAPVLRADDGIGARRRGRRPGRALRRLSQAGHLRRRAAARAVAVPHRPQSLHRPAAPARRARGGRGGSGGARRRRAGGSARAGARPGRRASGARPAADGARLRAPEGRLRLLAGGHRAAGRLDGRRRQGGAEPRPRQAGGGAGADAAAQAEDARDRAAAAALRRALQPAGLGRPARRSSPRTRGCGWPMPSPGRCPPRRTSAGGPPCGCRGGWPPARSTASPP